MSDSQTSVRGFIDGFVPGLQVISGCMFAGKSEELIRRLKRWQHSRLGVVTLKPARDTRSENVCSRNGCSLEAVEVQTSEQILTIVQESDKVIGIDEIHFFDPQIVEVVLRLVRKGKLVIVSGLNLDFAEKPFENTMKLMALASNVTIAFAVCDICRSQYATRSQLLVPSTGRILVGDKEYSPRCIECFQTPPSTPL